MRNERYREDNREALTNEDIKTGLKKDANSKLVSSAIFFFAILIIDFVIGGAVCNFSEHPILFWSLVLTLFGVSFSVIWGIVTETKQALFYINAIRHNRFFVVADTLINKKEGRSAPIGSSMYRTLRTQPDRYYFASGTYEVAVEVHHYHHSEKFAMRETTLFKQSQYGDSFLLVSLKPGKPVKIYPEKLFDYKDSSPL